MRYILTLFLISLVASSEIINKADEIQEFSEYDDVELQFFFIPFLVKAVTAGIGLIAKAKAIVTGAKIFKFVKGAVSVGSKIFKGAKGFIAKGKALLTKSKIFRTGKQIFERGKHLYTKYKGAIERTKIFQKGKRLYDKGVNIYNKYKAALEKNKLYQTYKKVKNTYDQVKDTYDKVNDYYEKGKDFYDRYIAKKDQNEQDNSQQAEEQRKRKEQRKKEEQRKKQLERNQAFTKYYQIKNNNRLTLTQKQSQLNAHLNYMQSKGFITPAVRQQMAKITPTYTTSRIIRNTVRPVKRL